MEYPPKFGRNANLKLGQSQPASATLRKTFEKAFSRGLEIEFFLWPGVDFLSNPSYFSIRNTTDVRSFGYILPYKLVAVFYGSFLPCAIRIGKEYRDMEFLAYPLMLGKLTAVVSGDGFQGLSLVRQQQPPYNPCKWLCFLSVLELFH